MNDDQPFFLQSFENLAAHFDEHFDNLDSNDKGDNFLAVARKLVPVTDEGYGFGEPKPSQRKSHDKGVDLYTSTNDKNETLCVQSKYKIRTKDEIDTIISKFKDYEIQKYGTGDGLFPSFASDEQNPTIIFMIITSSKLEGIISSYKSSHLASKDYYNALVGQNRLFIIDGPRVLSILQRLYRKAHLLPTNVEITSSHGWVTVGSVHLGAILGSNLLSLYDRHGDSLFFENIRDFLGITSGKKVASDRETVNEEIIRTIENEPQRMLERNNGITLRAAKLEIQR